MIGGRTNFLSQMNQKLIKLGDIIVDLSSFENGFQKEKKRVPTRNMGLCSVP